MPYKCAWVKRIVERFCLDYLFVLLLVVSVRSILSAGESLFFPPFSGCCRWTTFFLGSSHLNLIKFIPKDKKKNTFTVPFFLLSLLLGGFFYFFLFKISTQKFILNLNFCHIVKEKKKNTKSSFLFLFKVVVPLSLETTHDVAFSDGII